MLKRRSHSSQHGQALVAMYLLFLVAVVVVSLASFQFAQVVFLQHKDSERVALNHSGSEGAAIYAQVDTSRADAPACANGGSGDLVFQPPGPGGPSDTLHYAYPAGGACGGGGAGGPGEQCVLCVLGPITNINRQVAVEGEIAINGNINMKHNGVLCSDLPGDSACDGKGLIYLGPGSSCCGSGGATVNPSVTAMSSTITDPLQGLYPKPAITTAGATVGGVAQSGVWNGTLSGVLASGGVFVVSNTGTLQGPVAVQAAYTSPAGTTFTATTVTVSPSPGWTTDKWAGHFVRQGALGTANIGRVVHNTANTLTLALSVGQPAWLPNTPSNGSAFTIDGTALVYLDGANVLLGTGQDIALAGPTSGPYQGAPVVAAATDTQTITFTGQSTMWLVGSIEAPGMALNVTGGGVSGLGLDTALGRIVVGSISALVSNNTTGLVVNGGLPGQTGCNAYSDTLTWSRGPTQRGQGRVQIQTSCSGGTGILSFDYSP